MVFFWSQDTRIRTFEIGQLTLTQVSQLTCFSAEVRLKDLVYTQPFLTAVRNDTWSYLLLQEYRIV